MVDPNDSLRFTFIRKQENTLLTKKTIKKKEKRKKTRSRPKKRPRKKEKLSSFLDRFLDKSLGRERIFFFFSFFLVIFYEFIPQELLIHYCVFFISLHFKNGKISTVISTIFCCQKSTLYY